MKLILSQACIEFRKGIFKCRRIPYNMSNQTHIHWTEKKKWTDAWHAAVLVAVSESTERPQNLARAHITIILYKHQPFDPDGAVNAIKPVLDGLRYAHVIQNDTTKHIKLSVKQKKVAHKNEERVEIEIIKI